MSRSSYQGCDQRSFPQALINLLEEEYRILGSHRVLEVLTKDVQQLVAEFYPTPEHISSGWMVFTGTRAVGNKAHPGQSGGEHELVTLAWPVLLPEDVQELVQQGDTVATREVWLQRRMARLIEYGQQQTQGPVLLTIADLALLLGLSTWKAGLLLEKARQLTGKPLYTKGYYFDQGMRPTHKAEIIALYEQGLDEAEIAHRCQHAPQSVGAYLRAYQRVRFLLSKQIPVEQISVQIGMQPSLVAAYLELIACYHPDLLPSEKR
jgi:hypothetical protein